MDPGPRPSRFRWPPKPLQPAPPSTLPATPTPKIHPAVSITTPATWRLRLLDVEREWLGLTRPPLDLRAHLADWNPDHPDAYCPRCAHTVGQFESTTNDQGHPCCAHCRDLRLPWDHAVRLGPFRGILRDAVLDTKFTAWRRLGLDLGRLLGLALLDALQDQGFPLDRVVLVPVPSSFRRIASRGIDHALAIAKGASRSTGLPVLQALRRRHRPSQLTVAPHTRAANVARTMSTQPNAKALHDRLPVVIDDVLTTGATASEACRALAASLPTPQPRPWIAILAVTPRQGEAGKTT